MTSDVEEGVRGLRYHRQAERDHNLCRAVVYPVGQEDRTKDFTSENYDENLHSETSAKTLSSGEDRK